MAKLLGLEAHLDDPDILSLPALKASKKAPYVISLLEEAFARKTLDEWSPILREHSVPHQKLFHYQDIVADKEAYDNDALRVVEYEAFGERALPTSPVRFDSYGDPPIILSKPLGYHTREYLEKFGYTAAEIDKLEAEGAVKCWHGEDVPDRVFVSRRQATGHATTWTTS